MRPTPAGPGAPADDVGRRLAAAWSPALPLPARPGMPVVVVLHGTRDPIGRAEQRELLDRLQAGVDGTVVGGVIEWASAGLPPVFQAVASAADQARATGIREVRIVPLLLFPAGHARDDMRVVVRGARRLHPDIGWRCMPLLSPGPAITAALVDRIRDAEAGSGRGADAIVVLGRGSTVASANARLERFVAAPVHAVDGRPVAVAFGSLAEPSLPAALERLHAKGARRVVVAPVLLHAGHFTRLAARQVAEVGALHPEMHVAVAAHLHGHPAVLAYIAARCSGERSRAAGFGADTAAGDAGAGSGARAPRAAVSSSSRPGRAAAGAPGRRPIVVAGTASGIGKTTVALGLMAALRRRGLRVQPFKVGPDYLDPLHHTEVCGRTSRNLDSVLCPRHAIPALAARATVGADVAVVEGVLGLFDGRLGGGDEGSTAEVARLLDAEVILVVDAARSSRSVAAVALGFAHFDRRLRIAGVVLNRIGSERHGEAARSAVEAAGLRVLGTLPRDDRIGIPERYLGLVPPQEGPLPRTWVGTVAAAVERHIDVDAILGAVEGGPPLTAEPLHDPFALPASPPRARLALARDAAFSFVYQDAIDLLAHRGAEIVPFSPLLDEALPACDAILLPGGFPERFAAVLEANLPMRRSVAAAAARGAPIVAECGGAMYLGSHITTEEGTRHAMCGVLPHGAVMTRRRRALGYRTATVLRDSPLLRRGETVTGHEFHWSSPDPAPDGRAAAWTLAESGGVSEGVAGPTLLASYVHLHLAGTGAGAARLVSAAQRAGATATGLWAR